MKKPVLVIMAAGMGSRYGGLKQIDPVDQEGHIIMVSRSLMQNWQQDLRKSYLLLRKKMKQILKKLLERELRRSWM